jgi:hypothetical protein
MNDPVAPSRSLPDLRALTPARVALGRAGVSLPTQALLDFTLDHARARDAVHATLDRSAVIAGLGVIGLSGLLVASQAGDRTTYLRRPDLGRRLDQASRRLLSGVGKAGELALVIGDGLSPTAVHAHAIELLRRLVVLLGADHLAIGHVAVAAGARVALGDEIGELLGVPYKNETVTADWKKISELDLEDEEKISLFDINNYLTNNLLYKMDSASMANSLEVRTPYLDYRLVEFSVNLPLQFKINNGTQKYLMKKLLERYIPQDLVYRTKWGFPAPVGDWLYKDLRYMIDKWLSREMILNAGILDDLFVRKVLKEFLAGKKYHHKRVWSMIIFQMWYYKYMDKNGG